MRYQSFFLFLLVSILFSFSTPFQKAKTYEFHDALAKQLIELEEISYLGNQKIGLKVRNTHKRKDIKIRIRPGLQFASQDTSEQDQIILKGRTFFVKAGYTSRPSFTSYCTQSKNRSPGNGSIFTIQERTDPKLKKLADFLSRFRAAEYTAQHAVWVFTDNHSMRGLHHDDPQKALAIQKFVSELSGKPIPGYTVRYRMPVDRQIAFTGEPISIHGEHKYLLEEDGVFSCSIYNEAGEEVQKVFEKMQQKSGYNRFRFQLDAKDLPKGKYVSRVFKDGELFQEIWVEG